MFPLDSNPGGIYDIDKFYQIPTNIAGINLNPIIKRFGFIPTTSSLDIGSGTQTITSGDYIRTYSPTVPPIGSKNVPFNNFFTNPLSNENHATLTINNAKWLWQEILGTPAFYSCSYACSGTNLEPVISGATLLCLQSPYTLSTVPSNALLTWSSSNINALTISPTNSATVTATRVNNFNGQVTITATVSGACGNVPITKNVYLGAGVSSVSFSNVQVYNISPTCYHLQGQTNEVPGATQYNYYIDNVLIGTNTGSTNTGFDGPAGKCNRTHTIRVDAILYCGGILSGTQNYNVSSTQCSLANCNITTLVSLPLSITVFPNPASTALTVQVIDSLSTNIESSMLDQSYQLFIMDRFSRKVFSAQSFDKTIHISTDELPSDIYYLNIIYKDLILRKQIILKK